MRVREQGSFRISSLRLLWRQSERVGLAAPAARSNNSGCHTLVMFERAGPMHCDHCGDDSILSSIHAFTLSHDSSLCLDANIDTRLTQEG